MVPGGAVNGMQQSFSGSPVLNRGDEFVFFLWTSNSGITWITGLTQGLFALPADAATADRDGDPAGEPRADAGRGHLAGREGHRAFDAVERPADADRGHPGRARRWQVMRNARLARAFALAAVAFALADSRRSLLSLRPLHQRRAFTPQQEKFRIAAGGTVSFFVSDQGPAVYAPGDSFGSLLGQVKQALAAWDSVSSPNLHVAFGGLETARQPSNTPGGDVVFQDLPPGLYGMGAPSSIGTTITHGIVILSNNTSKGAGPSYLENFFTTAVHEIGHALGLQHTWTGSAMSQDVLRNTSRARPFDADDVAAINTLYGPNGWQNNFGSISGTVRFANGTPVSLASVVMLNPTTGAAVSALTNPDGTYRIDGIPAGNFLLYVHPLPPDAVPADGTGLRLPQDPNGNSLQPSGAFGTVFYPNTTDPSQATTFTITRGFPANGQNVNFTVQPRTSVPAYDLITYSFLDPRSLTPVYDTTTVTGPIPVYPGIHQLHAGDAAREGACELGRRTGAAIGDHPGRFRHRVRRSICRPSPTQAPDGGRWHSTWRCRFSPAPVRATWCSTTATISTCFRRPSTWCRGRRPRLLPSRRTPMAA